MGLPGPRAHGGKARASMSVPLRVCPCVYLCTSLLIPLHVSIYARVRVCVRASVSLCAFGVGNPRVQVRIAFEQEQR